MISIEKAMDLIEDSVEGYHYSHNNGYEIMFKKSDNYWKVRKLKEKSFWETFDSRLVIAVFNRRGLNIGDFQAELNQNLITSAIYHNMRFKKLEKELGKTVIEESIKNWDEFGKSLASIIKKEMIKKTIQVIK